MDNINQKLNMKMYKIFPDTLQSIVSKYPSIYEIYIKIFGDFELEINNFYDSVTVQISGRVD